jgi:tetratricopeptide (TPR) repeat protein
MLLSEDAMRDDSDPLRDIDLSAWEVPAARGDLADAVVARMTEAAAVSPVTTMVAMPPSRARWLVWGGLAATCAAAIAIIIIVGSSRDEAHGVVVADHARHLDLDSATAELDQGADVRWHRDHTSVHVEQPRGVASWKVGADQQLVIDPGAMGASIEATGASLRVEVRMNQADSRVIAASAATAAIAALVTVVVYEGFVTVRSGGQTVNVAPGATVEVAPNKAPALLPSPRDLRSVDDALDRTLAASRDQLAACETALAMQNWAVARTCVVKHIADAPARAQVLLVQIDDELRTSAVMEQIRAAVAAKDWTLARTLADSTSVRSSQHYKVERLVADAPCGSGDLVASARRESEAGLFGDALVKLEKTLACQPDPAVEALAIDAACNAKGEVHAGAYVAVRAANEHQSVGAYCAAHSTTIGPSAPVLPCDADELQRKGIGFVDNGDLSAGLDEFEHALACKPSSELTRLAYLAACNGRNDAKARTYYAKLSPDEQASAKAMCFRNGIDSAGCDAAALHDQGIREVNLGDYAVALTTFEQSLACKPAMDTTRLAYLAACHTKNATKARQHFAELPPFQQRDLEALCLREGISLTAAPPCDATTPHDRGIADVNLGQYAAALGEFERALACKSSTDTVRLAYLAACHAKNAAKARLYFAKLPSLQQRDLAIMCVRDGIDVTAGSCDATALKDKGVQLVNLGMYAPALAQFEQSLACKTDTSVVQLAYLAACHAKTVDKARHYYDLLPPARQAALQPICVREGVDVGCDAAALKSKGIDFVNLGNYAAALEQFEKSLACKTNHDVTRLAYLAACNSKNASKARHYYAQLPTIMQRDLQGLCLRDGVQVP